VWCRWSAAEIADDLAGYFASSQQVPSIVALGVLAGPEGIKVAGGIIAQLLPGADEGTIARLEANAAAMPPVTSQIADGAGEHDLDRAPGRRHRRALHDVAFTPTFDCRCTRERVEAALLALGRDELLKLATEREQTEASCDFCKRRYVLTAAATSASSPPGSNRKALDAAADARVELFDHLAWPTFLYHQPHSQRIGRASSFGYGRPGRSAGTRRSGRRSNAAGCR